MGFFDTITGKAVSDKVEEYSETYGEVLLGMHRDLEKHKYLLDDSARRIGSLEDGTAALTRRISDVESRSERLRAEVNHRFEAFGSNMEQLRSEVTSLAERQSHMLQDWSRRFDQLQDRTKSMAGRVDALETGSQQWRTRIESKLDSFGSTVEKLRSEASALSEARKRLSVLTEEVAQQSASVRSNLHAYDGQIRKLRLLCTLSYALTLALGVVLWFTR